MEYTFRNIQLFFRRIYYYVNGNLAYYILNYKFRKSKMYKIHCYSLKKYLSIGSIKTIFVRYIFACLMPFLYVFASMYYVKRFGGIISLTYDIKRKNLFFKSILMWACKNVPPVDYYRYELYLEENKSKIEHLIFFYEANILLRNLNSSVDLDIVDDKCKFYDICKNNKLKIPHIYGIIDSKKSFIELPKEDLIIKPSKGSKAEDIELWIYEENKYCNKDIKLVGEELNEHILEKYMELGTMLIVQHRIKNHSKLNDLTTGALLTARVVTVRTLKNEIIHLMSVLIIPVGERMLRHPTILSPIDEKTGELGIATTYGLIAKTFEYHPDTKAQLVGFKVPYWDEVISITKEAHKYFLDYMSLGWDIAITDDGPVIIEANRIWDVETMQKPHGIPLGNTVFADLCCEIIDKTK